MPTLIIERVLDTRFEFELNGDGKIISSDQNRLLTDGSFCHFKTGTGANIIKEQNVSFSDITVIDTFGGTGSHTFLTVQALWVKLIELKFFDGLAAAGGGGGSTTLIGLTDTPSTYLNQDGKVMVVNESQQKIEFQTFYNINELTDLDDVAISSLIADKIIGVESVSGVLKFVLIDKPTDGTTYFSAVGGFDYNDEGTTTTPLAYTSGDLQLTNDILGDYTFLGQPPYGITSVWDEITNTFDFSQLSLGDEVFFRIKINVTTTVSNQVSALKLKLLEGLAGEYDEIIDSEIAFKSAGLHKINRNHKIYIGSNDLKNTPIKLLFSSDTSATVTVEGWHVYIIRKSVNLLDVKSKIDAVYSNTTTLFAAQSSQEANSIYEVTDGSGFTGINGTDSVWVRYKGTVAGDETDYIVCPNKDAAFDMDNMVKPTTSKTTPIDADSISLWDSVTSMFKELTWANLKATLKTYFDTIYQAILTAANFGSFVNGLTSKTTPVDADEIVISDSADSLNAKKVSLTNFKTYLANTFVLISNYLEEKILGTALYNAGLTGATDIDLNTFSDYYGILTGNTTITFTNTPASGKTIVRTMELSGNYTFAISGVTSEIGSYDGTATVNILYIKISNFPTAGLKIRVEYQNIA